MGGLLNRPATVVSLDVSLRRMDGGGKRVLAFLSALENEASDVEVIGVGPVGIQSVEKVVASPLHRVKRRVLPIPLRRPVELELSGRVSSGPTLSLVPSANRWTLDNRPSWLDFPDLWSDIARNHSRNVDPFSGMVNRAQARMWSRRERAQYSTANVVSVASWTDRIALGDKAVWLPTPVVTAADLDESRQRPGVDTGLTFGMIANFDYPPNWDAYERLVREWLPALRTSATQMVVAGFGSERLPRVRNVDILGPVDAVDGFYDRVDVVVAPIELGGGMKVKVVEAMAHGVPVLATSHAANGLPAAIADECVKWGEPLPSDFRDPRGVDSVRDALRCFTFESFQETFGALWRERMAGDG